MANQFSYFQKLLSEREQELSERNEELEAQHEELTAAVEALIDKNARLESALEELHTRNQEIDQIVYRTSHDLKTPITSLEGLFDLMQVDGETNMEEYVDLAKKSTDDMKRMLQMLVRYSNNLVQSVNIEEVHIDRLQQVLEEELCELSGYDEVKINWSTSSIKSFKSDFERIKLILYNLIKNSIDFRKFGVGNTRIEIKFQEKHGVTKILVSDNGIGIPQNIQEEVFNMFFRGTNQSKGSGLGLYLCKRNVDLLDGKLNLMSSEQVGTTVQVDIPQK